MQEYGIIYKITNKVTGKSYIGQTMGTMKDRWQGHWDDTKRKNTPFSRTLRKRGRDGFEITILGEFFYELLDLAEKIAIKEYNTLIPNGYNVLTGGQKGCRGFKHSAESKAKMSAARSGPKHFMYGKKMPRWRIEILRKHNLGRPLSLEHIQKCGDAIRKSKVEIKIGDVFGKLIVREFLGIRRAGEGTVYRCDCQCGTKNIIVLRWRLEAGKKRSCGCIVGKALLGTVKGPEESKEVIGKKFGMLQALEIIRDEKGLYKIRCLCDCGKICLKRACDLKRGAVRSCSCLRKSHPRATGSGRFIGKRYRLNQAGENPATGSSNL